MSDGKKNIKKALTQESDVTYGSHHGPGLPSVPAVVACWHPLVTAQDENNPGQRIQGTVIRGVRTESPEERISALGEGRSLSGRYCAVQKISGIWRKQVLNSSVWFNWV